jgi:hypothetical protein
LTPLAFSQTAGCGNCRARARRAPDQWYAPTRTFRSSGTRTISSVTVRAPKAKIARRVAKMMAKKAGDLGRMPLSGKAALDAIRS